MKKLFAICLLAAVFAVPATFAQAASTEAVTAPEPGAPGGPNPAKMIQRRVQTMTTVLSLTSAQQTQVTTILTNSAAAESGFHTSMRAAHKNLKTAIESNDAASIEQISNQIGTLTAQTIAAHAKTEAAIYQVLSAEQQTKASQLGDDMLGGFGGPGPGGHGGPRE
jgi:Spy/CpxP family protein refolding chaperone